MTRKEAAGLTLLGLVVAGAVANEVLTGDLRLILLGLVGLGLLATFLVGFRDQEVG